MANIHIAVGSIAFALITFGWVIARQTNFAISPIHLAMIGLLTVLFGNHPVIGLALSLIMFGSAIAAVPTHVFVPMILTAIVLLICC